MRSTLDLRCSFLRNLRIITSFVAIGDTVYAVPLNYKQARTNEQTLRKPASVARAPLLNYSQFSPQCSSSAAQCQFCCTPSVLGQKER